MSAGIGFRTRFNALVGTRRGRVLATVLVGCVLLGLPALAVGALRQSFYLADKTRHVALGFLESGAVVFAFVAAAAALLFAAGC